MSMLECPTFSDHERQLMCDETLNLKIRNIMVQSGSNGFSATIMHFFVKQIVSANEKFLQVTCRQPIKLKQLNSISVNL